ncbi:protein MTSS 1-like isoform X2 [Anneissia japonica]|uniref:protein MTSS 1-like isoform X2 n=1 Tax=Anneissia japonica TaxID=1529436 RepID=UPI0014259A6C|nr:protein MTSS 1-like isoform X2 [Anneissia japonica]
MEATIERDCSALGGLFQAIINDMKSGTPLWEDFISKTAKLHTQYKATILVMTAWLESFQKIADSATNSRGATKEIGSALTRMCMRHKSIEIKLKSFTASLMDCLVLPLQEKVEDWKKITTQLDKDHAKEYKKARHEIKKKSTDTLRLQKKAKKGKMDVQYRLDSALQEVTDKYLLLEETEKAAVRNCLVEERSRYCTFVTLIKPVVDEECSMLSETTHLSTILDDIMIQVKDPYTLPKASEQVILDIKGQENKWSFPTPPGSPVASTGSRKSSMCSLSSMASSDSRSSGSVNSHSPGNPFRHRSMSQPTESPLRLSSVSSQDSGFISQDMLFQRPATPPQESDYQTIGQNGDQSSSECSTPSYDSLPPPPPSWTSWSSNNSLNQSMPLPPPPVTNSSLPEKPLVNSKSKNNDVVLSPCPPIVPDFNMTHINQAATVGQSDPLYDELSNLHFHETIVPQPTGMEGKRQNPYEHRRTRSATLPQKKVSQPALPVTADLAMALARGLGAHTPGGRNLANVQHSQLSLQSSGYGTQTTTPSASDDTIASEDFDCYSLQAEKQTDLIFEKPSTIPRNGDVSNSYQHTSTPRRPASTAGLPFAATPANNMNRRAVPSYCTLRRGKPPPPVRRTSLTSGSSPSTTPTHQSETVFDYSGTFKIPLPVDQAPVPQSSPPKTRPSNLGRSQSLRTSHDMHQAGNRQSLMESLNAKLAQRQSMFASTEPRPSPPKPTLSPQRSNEPQSPPSVYDLQKTPTPGSYMSQQYAPPPGYGNQTTPTNYHQQHVTYQSREMTETGLQRRHSSIESTQYYRSMHMGTLKEPDEEEEDSKPSGLLLELQKVKLRSTRTNDRSKPII